MAEKNKYTAIGRRKRSVAKVTLVPGKGNITVNGKDVKDYMPYETLVMDLVQPLELTDSKEKYDINKSTANDLIDFIFEEISNSIIDEKKVVITNFAGFRVKKGKTTGKNHFSCSVSTNLKKRIKQLD